jgi:hypothetical protein
MNYYMTINLLEEMRPQLIVSEPTRGLCIALSHISGKQMAMQSPAYLQPTLDEVEAAIKRSTATYLWLTTAVVHQLQDDLTEDQQRRLLAEDLPNYRLRHLWLDKAIAATTANGRIGTFRFTSAEARKVLEDAAL